MTYNIHPLFVHFPIALLFIYSIIKIIPFHIVLPNVSWKHIERVLLLAGVLGAFVSSSTGEIAEHLVESNRQIIEMHKLFAAASTWFYGLLLLGEALYLLNPIISLKLQIPPLNNFLNFIQKILTNRILSIILTLLGLVAISITGLLGGVLVYGVSADPVAPVVLRLFGISL